MRREGHDLLFASQVASDRSGFDERLAASASEREQLLRQTARVIRRSSLAAQLQAYASLMETQADVDRQEAQRLNREAGQLRWASVTAEFKARLRFQTAGWLDPGGV